MIYALVAFSLATGWLLEDLAPAARWTLALLLSAALFASVLLHEVAHAVVARWRGIDVDEIALFIFGGVAKLKEEPRTPLADLLIAAVGPATSLAIGLLVLGAGALLPSATPAPVATGIRWLGTINVALAVFNMVPGFPLDGGRILRAILWWRFDDYDRATVAAARAGRVLASVLMATGLALLVATRNAAWLWEVLIGWFLWAAAGQAIRVTRLRRAVEGVTVRDLVTARIPSVRADHDVRVAAVQTRDLDDQAEIAVVDRDGALVGVALIGTIRDTNAVKPDRLVRDLARVPREEQILQGDIAARALIERLDRLQGALPLVVEDGRLVGTIDPGRLFEAIEAARS